MFGYLTLATRRFYQMAQKRCRHIGILCDDTNYLYYPDTQKTFGLYLPTKLINVWEILKQ